MIKRCSNIENYRTLKHQLGNIYWEIKESPALSFFSFYRFAFEDKYKNAASFTTIISQKAFSNTCKTPTQKDYDSILRMVNKYECYKMYILNSIPKPGTYKK